MSYDVRIWTDGSSATDASSAGAAAVLVGGRSVLRLGTYCEGGATNQQAELFGVLLALSNVRRVGLRLAVTSDSEYVVKGFSSWIANWRQNGWRNSAKKPVANRELWETIDGWIALHEQVDFFHTRGHRGNYYNEVCDRIAHRCRVEQVRVAHRTPRTRSKT